MKAGQRKSQEKPNKFNQFQLPWLINMDQRSLQRVLGVFTDFSVVTGLSMFLIS